MIEGDIGALLADRVVAAGRYPDMQDPDECKMPEAVYKETLGC